MGTMCRLQGLPVSYSCAPDTWLQCTERCSPSQSNDVQVFQQKRAEGLEVSACELPGAHRVCPRQEGSGRGGVSASSEARMCNPATRGSPWASLLGRLASLQGTCISVSSTVLEWDGVEKGEGLLMTLQTRFFLCKLSGLQGLGSAAPATHSTITVFLSTIYVPAVDYLVPDRLH